MVFIREYDEGDYNITQYTCGGTIRDRLTGDILAEYTNWWTPTNEIHTKTQEQLDHIKRKLKLIIAPKHLRK